jgi:type IV pilus assembly protein PilA
MIKKIKNKKAFTIIELLIVIVIIGIMAAITIPAIQGILINNDENKKIEVITQDQEQEMNKNTPVEEKTEEYKGEKRL